MIACVHQNELSGSARPVTFDFGVVIGAGTTDLRFACPHRTRIRIHMHTPVSSRHMHWCARRKQQHAACLISFRWQDHAFAGIGAGTVAVLCMNPLDLLKVKFQVSTSVRAPGGGMGRGIWFGLRDIHASEGWRGLYRGLGPNIAGNASSWGLYFLLLRVLPPFLSFKVFRFLLLWPAIISSSVARRSGRRTDLSPPRSTSSIPPKRVRIFFYSSLTLFDHPLQLSFSV